LRKNKKSANRSHSIRNKRKIRRKAKAFAKAKKRSDLKSKKKNSDKVQFDEMREKINNPLITNEQKLFIKKTFKDTLQEYSKVETACFFSSLLLIPSYQSSQYRLEKAIAISLSFCEGDKKPDKNLIDFILEKSSDLFGMMEDPAEDVFISTIWFENKQYKTSTGLWEGGVYQTQIFLNFLETAPNNSKNLKIKKKVAAILKASDLIITKNELKANEIGGEYPVSEINIDELNDINVNIDKVKLNSFLESAFLPCIEKSEVSNLYAQEFGASDLEEKPFIINKGNCFLALPSSILACIKRQIIKFVREEYSGEHLDSLFFSHQAQKLHETTLLKKLKNSPVAFYPIKDVNGWMSSEFIVEFDKGYFFQFIILGESLNAIDGDWFDGFTSPRKKLSKYIKKSIAQAKTFSIEKQNGYKGCTIIVPCGYGRGLGVGLDFKKNETWTLMVISSHDLDTLSNDSDCTPHKIWRLIESIDQLNNMGVYLMNPNGFLNLYAYAKQNNYCLVPHESFQDPESDLSNIMISLPNNSQAGLRAQVLKNTERLLLDHHDLGSIKVVRCFGNSLFSHNEKYDIFCTEAVNPNLFQCVYIENDYKIWIEQEIIKDYAFAIQLQFFETALSWIKKIIVTLKSNSLNLPTNLQVWSLSYDFPEDVHKVRDCPSPEKILSSFSNKFVSPVLYSHFGVEFVEGLRSEFNFSEQALVLSIVSYICDFNQNVDSEKFLHKIVENVDAKHTHFFVANKYREYFIEDKSEPIYIEKTDEQNLKLNFGWSCRDRNQGNVIEGKSACKKFLNELVEHAWDLIKNKLCLLNRESLIKKLLINMEHCNHQKARWERTFKANLALQKDKENLYSVVYDKIRKLNGASLSTRLVIEMAICECPLNSGKEVGILDIQELICFASLMHHLGGISEAINYDVLEPKLIISAFGDIMYNHDFEDTILKYYSSEINKSFLSYSVKDYPKHFNQTETVKTVNNLFDEDFNKAWMYEFGFTIDDARQFFEKLEDYGLKQNELVYNISYENIIEMFDKKRIEVVDNILKTLTIYPRDTWTEIPASFKPTDWQPWKFRRRFSLIMRPLVQYDDSEFLISPQHIRDGFFYFVRCCHSATLDENNFSTHWMKKWIGDARRVNGLAFNSKVANRLQELGWTVREEIKLTEILNKKLLDLGDVDVLAWNSELNLVAIVECKALDFAKTQGEIARQLYDFKGQKNNKRKDDKLLKHINRLDVLKENTEQLSKFTNLNLDQVVKGYVVFSNTVPMEFNENRSHKNQIEFLTFEQLGQLGSK
jgi:hypothetical protein